MALSAERPFLLVKNCSVRLTARLASASASRADIRCANWEAAKRFWSAVTMSIVILYSSDMAAAREVRFIVGLMVGDVGWCGLLYFLGLSR